MGTPAEYVPFNAENNVFSGSLDQKTPIIFQWPKLAQLTARGSEGLNIFKWALASLKKSRFCYKEGHTHI